MLAGGGTVGQANTLLTVPIMIRQITPVEFGVYGVHVATLENWTVIATLRYESAIPIVRTGSAVSNVLVLVLGCHVLWLTPLGIAFIGHDQAYSNWATQGKCEPA